MDTGAWWAKVHGGQKELDTTEQLSTYAGYMTEVNLWPTASEFMSRPSIKFEQFGIFIFLSVSFVKNTFGINVIILRKFFLLTGND